MVLVIDYLGQLMCYQVLVYLLYQMVLLLVRISDNLNIGSNLAISYRKALIGPSTNRTYYIYYSNRKVCYCWVLLIRLIKCQSILYQIFSYSFIETSRKSSYSCWVDYIITQEGWSLMKLICAIEMFVFDLGLIQIILCQVHIMLVSMLDQVKQKTVLYLSQELFSEVLDLKTANIPFGDEMLGFTLQQLRLYS